MKTKQFWSCTIDHHKHGTQGAAEKCIAAYKKIDQEAKKRALAARQQEQADAKNYVALWNHRLGLATQESSSNEYSESQAADASIRGEIVEHRLIAEGNTTAKLKHAAWCIATM